MAQQKRKHNTKYYPDRISNKQTQKPYESAISISLEHLSEELRIDR